MSGIFRYSLTLFATVAIATTVHFGIPVPLSGSVPQQESPEITEEECAFWLDYDDDGEGNQRIGEGFVLQETAVVGGCDFKVSVPEPAAIKFESELDDWEADVEVKREPGTTDEYKIYSGKPDIVGVEGSMRVIVNFVRGHTPRTGRVRDLPDDYRHIVQIPVRFRLLEVSVITPDGSQDRLEQNAESATGAYIASHGTMREMDNIPDWCEKLAGSWLEDGYPQVATSVAEACVQSDPGIGGWWRWAAIITWVALPLIAIAVALFYLLAVFGKKRPPPIPPDNRL